jgi:hypothetical protein
VGVILFEMLSGRRPFSGDWDELYKAKQGSVPSPGTFKPGALRDLSQLCVALLHPRPEARPTGAQIIQQLEGLAPADLAPNVPRSPDNTGIGRLGLLPTLQQAFSETQAGHPVVIHLVGQAGEGKTTLAQHFLRELKSKDAVVLAGQCSERVSVLYPGLDTLVDALSNYLQKLKPSAVDAVLPRDVGALVRVFPVLGRAALVSAAVEDKLIFYDAQDLQQRALRALSELLGRIADRVPLAIFVDNFQWADEASAQLLAELVSPPNFARILLLAAYRTQGADAIPAIAALCRAPHRKLNLNEFTKSEAEEILRRNVRSLNRFSPGGKKAAGKSHPGSPLPKRAQRIVAGQLPRPTRPRWGDRALMASWLGGAPLEL